ncbi:MAG: Spy/CpxP family protein refolding chaperone [Burkholderiales bacterium]
MIRVAAVAAVSSLAAMSVSAQLSPPKQPSLADRPRPAQNAGARPAGANLAELVNLRVAQLEEDLNLTAAQLPAWNAYRDRVMRMLDDQRRGARISAAETTAPKRLDGLADIARNRLAAVEDIVDAGKSLYAVLTPEQRAIADRRLALPLATLSGQETGGDARGDDPLPARPPPPR